MMWEASWPQALYTTVQTPRPNPLKGFERQQHLQTRLYIEAGWDPTMNPVAKPMRTQQLHLQLPAAHPECARPTALPAAVSLEAVWPCATGMTRRATQMCACLLCHSKTQ